MPVAHKTQKTPVFKPEKLSQITSAVRSLCILYNTTLTYETTHKVFEKAVEERMPEFKEALVGTDGIPLFFSDGQIRAGASILDPGSGMFSRFSRELEGMGISAISILPSVSAADIKAFMRILTTKSDDIRTRGLQHFLSIENVRSFFEHKMKTQIVASDAPVGDAQARPAGGMRSRKGGDADIGTWNIDLDASTGSDAGDSAAVFSRSFKGFVRGALDALDRREASLRDVVDIISTEFEHRLTQRIEDVRKSSEKKVRRLETIKDLILKELEAHGVAAFVVDLDLNVLSANDRARAMIGEMRRVERTSDLGAFILSQHEDRREIAVEGIRRTVHLLTSTSPQSGDTLMLVSLE